MVRFTVAAASGMLLFSLQAQAQAQDKPPEGAFLIGSVAAPVIDLGPSTKDSSGCNDSPRLFCGDIEQGDLNTECITTNQNGTDIYLDNYHFVLNSERRVIMSYSAQFSTTNFGDDQLDPWLRFTEDQNGDFDSGGEVVVAGNDDSCWPECASRNSQIDTVLGPGTYLVRVESFGEFQTGPYALNLTCPPAPNSNVVTAHSGVWESVNQNGSGFPVHILSGGNAVGYWFTYRDQQAALTSFWAAMPGTVSGNTINFDIIDLNGPGFGPDYNAGNLGVRSFGQGRLSVFGCSAGLFEFFSEVPMDFPSYAMTVNKFAGVAGLNCP